MFFSKNSFVFVITLSISSALFGAVGIKPLELEYAKRIAQETCDPVLMEALSTLVDNGQVIADSLLNKQKGKYFFWMALVAAIEQNNAAVFNAIVPKHIKFTDKKPYGRPVTPIEMINYYKSSNLLPILEQYQVGLLDSSVSSMQTLEEKKAQARVIVEKLKSFKRKLINWQTRIDRTDNNTLINALELYQESGDLNIIFTELVHASFEELVERRVSIYEFFRSFLKSSLLEYAHRVVDCGSLQNDTFNFALVLLEAEAFIRTIISQS